MNSQQIRESVCKTIVESLKNGNLPPWRKPWSNDPNCGHPCNVVSRRGYRGINPLLLQIASMRHGFQSRWWATFNQWKEMGGFVKRRPENVPPGQWGATIIYFSPVTKTVVRDGEETEDTFAVMRTYCVFNLDAVVGPFDHLRPGYTTTQPGEIEQRCERANQVIAATGADIRHGGNEAFYSPRGDYVQIPFRHQFKDEYYETVFHELSHWATHPSRVPLDYPETSNRYAFEELVAEISGCYLTSEMGLPTSQISDNHLAYLAHWLKAMDDPKFIFSAASKATKVTDYVLSFSHTEEAEESEPAIVE